uniref:Uncharacterized protein n=1 Tax=Cannabis sativa TaxID=3483 RepID=A0A803PWX5_CANSA
MWKSLVWGKEILHQGARWQIGDGNEVDLLNDPWIPRPTTFNIYDKLHLPPDLKFIDLKLANDQWDAEFIRAIFTEDSRLILNIPSEEARIKDTFIWHYTKNRDYNVCSGYRVAIDQIYENKIPLDVNLENESTP